MTKKKRKKYTPGHWMGIGIALGIPLGTALMFVADLVTGEFGSMFFLGPGIGVALGTSIGAYLEAKHEHETRKLTPREKKRLRKYISLGIIVLALGALVGLLAFMAFL